MMVVLALQFDLLGVQQGDWVMMIVVVGCTLVKLQV
jgi:hypothetical protein